MTYQPGDPVLLTCPENPRLNGQPATVSIVSSWGALVLTPAAATGQYRAGWDEMIPVRANGAAPKAPSATGDLCKYCGSANMIRTGACVTCGDCGESGGCS